MRAVVQRVREASVSVAGEITASIGPGVLVLLGVAAGDTPGDVKRLAGKVARLRIFENEAGRFDRSLLDTSGAALVVSQFTLIADTRKGNRRTSRVPRILISPSSSTTTFAGALQELGASVSRGVFGARMTVSLVNDGPVTIVLDA